MGVPAEVAFHRYFQEKFPKIKPVCPEYPDRREYRGRHDLSELRPSLQEQLRTLQSNFNESLLNEKQGLEFHIDHPPFHFDYIDSDVKNARAFQFEDYSFIGITIPLIYEISDISLRSSISPQLALMLGVEVSEEPYNPLQTVLFNILLSFVVAHEWTHHVHGHVGAEYGKAVFRDENGDGVSGSLNYQIEEIAADGYSAYHVLANLLDGSLRPGATQVLKLPNQNQDLELQDRVLFALFIISIGGYMLSRPAPPLELESLYSGTHPPSVARMNCLVQEALGWCEQNRPNLIPFAQAAFSELMNATAYAVMGASGTTLWLAQNRFLKSDEGLRYRTALTDGINNYRAMRLARHQIEERNHYALLVDTLASSPIPEDRELIKRELARLTLGE